MTNVLIADDDAAICKVLRLMLEDAGYHTQSTSDGRATLEVLRRDPQPLIALIDIKMPKLDGLSIMRIATRQSFQRLGHPRAFILMTAYTESASDPIEADLTQLHAQRLQKPFDEADVVNAVTQAAEQLEQQGCE